MKGVSYNKFGGFVHPSELPMAGGGTYTSGGMTLRDWFAGQAMAAYLSRPDADNDPYAAVASYAFDMADAMLAERSKP